MLELIRIVKRALKYKSPTDYCVEKMIIEKLERLNISNKDAIISKIKETYDDVVLVNSIKLLREDTTGKKLENYLGIN